MIVLNKGTIINCITEKNWSKKIYYKLYIWY